MFGPDPTSPSPLLQAPRVGFLRPLVGHPKIEVGAYTYYDDPDGPEHFVDRCVRYLFDFSEDRLIIGKFCAIATGVQFIMGDANHSTDGFSSYPFEIFGDGWEAKASAPSVYRGNTIVGNDVWIGTEATIMPHVTIGSGAIIGAKSVVTKSVPPYAVAVGNPAKVIKARFSEETIADLLEVAWWEWDAEKITRNLGVIRGSDIAALKAAQ